MLLIFLRPASYLCRMDKVEPKKARPDIDAATRGGDWAQTMDGEGLPENSTIEHALYWRHIYTEILEMEEKGLARIRQLMATQSEERRRRVELTKVPVVAAQAARCAPRLRYS